MHVSMMDESKFMPGRLRAATVFKLARGENQPRLEKSSCISWWVLQRTRHDENNAHGLACVLLRGINERSHTNVVAYTGTGLARERG